jgi:hypothetical protein
MHYRLRKIMPTDTDLDSPVSHAITDGWADFAQMVLPGVGGDKDGEAHIAFHIGAMYVLQIAQHVLAERAGEEAALVLGMLDAEIEEFMQAHAVAMQ